jgi:hypothetical protein
LGSLGIENRKPKIINFSLSKPATTTQKKLKIKIILFLFLFFSRVRTDAAQRTRGQQTASAREGVGEGRGGREREGEGGNACVREDAHVRADAIGPADAFCGWRFEGGREVSSSAQTGLCPRRRMVASARTRVFYPQVTS